MLFDCLIIGGGLAGLQAAIQLGRYNHTILVIDAGYGRSTLCRSYRNILGYPNGINGIQLRKIGRNQAKKVGVTFINDKIIKVKQIQGGFQLQSIDKKTIYTGKRLLFATGIKDRILPIPGLINCLGVSLYICPDCDGYEVKNYKTIVIGSGNTGATMALTITYYSNHILYINHEKTKVSQSLLNKLKTKKIIYIKESIEKVISSSKGILSGLKLRNGNYISCKKGFVAFGNNKVESDLAKQLGVERLENKHILTHPRTKMTNIQHVWAIGDVVAHSQLATIAMGEGSQAAISIHKSLISNS